MVADVLWIARYQLLEELWRDRPRLLVDPDLERVLAQAGPGVAHGSQESLVDLVDALLPRRTGGAGVWFAVSEASVDELSAARPGVRFLPRGALTQTLGEPWEVAVIDLSAVLAEVDASVPSSSRVFTPRGEALMQRLGAAVHDGQTVVLTVPVRDYPRTTHGLSYDELADVLGEYFGGGRIHGVFTPRMAAVVDFGGDDDSDDENGDVPLLYDNTLGTDDPELSLFVAVAGSAEALVDGMALIELPAPGRYEGGAIEDRELQAQVTESRRFADRMAIERQTLLEETDRLQGENRDLRDEVHELRRRLARAVATPTPSSGGEGSTVQEREDAALAREQTLRWRIEQLEAEVETLRRRPVEDLEAEVASLRARLEAVPIPTAAAGSEHTEEPPILSEGYGEDAPLVRRAARLKGTVGELEGLARRLERDERLGALELRRKLMAILAAMRL